MGNYSVQLDSFLLKLKTRRETGRTQIPQDTVNFLRQLLSTKRFSSVENVISYLEKLEKPLEEYSKTEVCPVNILKRVIYIAQEENHLLVQESLEELGLNNEERNNLTAKLDIDSFIARLLQGIDELEDEFNSASATMSSHSWEHIHSNELILTAGNSETVEQFLKVASSARNFSILVTETGSSFEGHKSALQLSTYGIDTTLISDGAIFAIMPEVSKVILGAHAVTANGGVIAVNGTYIVTATAKHFFTPVVFLVELHKISPTPVYDPMSFCNLKSPENVYSFSDENMDEIKIIDPAYDYIPPEFVSLYITNVGTYPPSSIQNLVKETYALYK